MKSISSLAFGAAALFASAHAQGTLPSQLVGTWSTKSDKVFTGPGFYDAAKDEFIEPALTGFSYSFTADGYYEEAYYRAISNPVNPQCPQGMMQWQHGSWVQNANGSLTLTPIAVDGRQLMSTPCSEKNGIYTRYNQTELFKTWAVYMDPYHKVTRLDLYAFDGAPLNPMYIAYNPPQMCATTTIHPTSTGTAAATGKSKVRKRAAEMDLPAGLKLSGRKGSVMRTALNPDWWWWVGMTFTGVGGLLYFGPRRMGVQL